MKEYTALHYVHDDKGTLHTPGEIFEAQYDEAAEKRLLLLGAVSLNAAEKAAAEVAVEEETVVDTDADDADDVSEMIDVMEGISEKKTAKRGKK